MCERDRDLLFRSTKMKDISEISPAYMKAYKNISKKSSADINRRGRSELFDQDKRDSSSPNSHETLLFAPHLVSWL